MKDDEVSSARKRVEVKGRRTFDSTENPKNQTVELLQREIMGKNNEILIEILQLMSKWESFVMEYRRISMCVAIICVITCVIVGLFLGRL